MKIRFDNPLDISQIMNCRGFFLITVLLAHWFILGACNCVFFFLVNALKKKPTRTAGVKIDRHEFSCSPALHQLSFQMHANLDELLFTVPFHGNFELHFETLWEHSE